MLRQTKAFKVQMAFSITALLMKSKIMTTSANGLTINDMKKAISIISEGRRVVAPPCMSTVDSTPP